MNEGNELMATVGDAHGFCSSWMHRIGDTDERKSVACATEDVAESLDGYQWCLSSTSYSNLDADCN
ncbi:MAG: hypothetical protein ACFB10_05270 [Salibacteraceae bacterium]